MKDTQKHQIRVPQAPYHVAQGGNPTLLFSQLSRSPVSLSLLVSFSLLHVLLLLVLSLRLVPCEMDLGEWCQ